MTGPIRPPAAAPDPASTQAPPTHAHPARLTRGRVNGRLCDGMTGPVPRPGRGPCGAGRRRICSRMKARGAADEGPARRPPRGQGPRSERRGRDRPTGPPAAPEPRLGTRATDTAQTKTADRASRARRGPAPTLRCGPTILRGDRRLGNAPMARLSRERPAQRARDSRQQKRNTAPGGQASAVRSQAWSGSNPCSAAARRAGAPGPKALSIGCRSSQTSSDLRRSRSPLG